MPPKTQHYLLIICTTMILLACTSNPVKTPKPSYQPRPIPSNTNKNESGTIESQNTTSSPTSPQQTHSVATGRFEPVVGNSANETSEAPVSSQSNQPASAPAPKSPAKPTPQTVKKTTKAVSKPKPKVRASTETSLVKKPEAKPATKEVKKAIKKPKLPVVNPTPTQPVTRAPIQNSEQQVALLDSSKTQSPELTKIEVKLDALPLAIDSWILDKPDNLEGTHCTLATKKAKIEDGVGGTPISLTIFHDKIVIPTKSNVDLSYESSQLRLDSGMSAKFDSVQKQTNVTIEKQYLTVIKSLKAAKLATIEMGFWPSWPQTHTYTVDIPVSGFSAAYQAWQDCNKIL